MDINNYYINYRKDRDLKEHHLYNLFLNIPSKTFLLSDTMNAVYSKRYYIEFINYRFGRTIFVYKSYKDM